jgi:hypothetical protein
LSKSLKVLALERDVLVEISAVCLAYSRSDLEINLDLCTFTSIGTSAFGRGLDAIRDRLVLLGVVLTSSIADGLRGNSRLKGMEPYIPSNGEDANH